MLAALIVVTGIAQVILSLFVFFRSKHNLSNRLFFFIGMSTLGWALADYLSSVYVNSPDVVYLARAVLFFVVLQNAFFYMFARAFPKTTWEYSKKLLITYGLVALLVAIATLSPFMFKSVDTHGNSTVTNVGPLIILFVAQIFFSVVVIFASLVKKLRQARSTYRSQLQILLFASFLLWIIVPITNFGITQLTGTTIFTKYAPVYTLVFTGIIAYAIVAQKLFDIRAAVARAVGYTFSLLIIAAVYGLVFFGVINVIFADKGSQLVREILQVLLVIILAVSFQSVKRFFDRITNRLFYKDNYDFGEVLNKIGAIAVAEIDLYKILNDVREVLSSALKSSFIEFMLVKNGQALFESRSKKVLPDAVLALREVLPHQRQELLVVDEQPIGKSVREALIDANVALSLQLRTQEQPVGFIIFGDKRSGDVYSEQDKKLLSILSSELAIAIQNALRFEEIQNFNLTLQEKVDVATHQLRQANERLKSLDETKDDFISMASHQLRTPLTSVKGYLSMVLDGDAGKISALQRKMLGQALISSQRMVFLITDLLNASRLKTGKFTIDQMPVSLANLITEEIEQLNDTAKARDLTLVYDAPKTFPELNLDETKTRQVIMNFIDNAIYYTNPGGKIEVKLSETDRTVELRVVDNGIGVPASERHHLFTKFYRAKNAQKARPDGTGIGLFMAKKVIIAEGGSTIFDSTEGKGSTFGFTFPKAKLLVKPSEPAKTTNKSISAEAEPAKEPSLL